MRRMALKIRGDLKGHFIITAYLWQGGAGVGRQSMDDVRRAEWDVCHLYKRVGGIKVHVR